MTAVALELLTRPPREPHADTLGEVALYAVEFIADTDNLTARCSCAASDDQPY
jgi:hypothetical protein